MHDINLLPEELKPSKSLLKLSINLKKFALLSVILLLITVVLSFSAYLFLKQRVSISLASQEKLKTEIKAMEKTEQRLVLVKDRLSKISIIKSNPNAGNEVEKLKNLISVLPESTKIKEVEISENKTDITIGSEKLSDIASYLASVVSSDNLTKIKLYYLKFNTDSGYELALSFPD